MIGRFQSVLCVSVFQGALLVIVIMIDGSKKHNCECSMFVKSAVEIAKCVHHTWLSMRRTCAVERD